MRLVHVGVGVSLPSGGSLPSAQRRLYGISLKISNGVYSDDEFIEALPTLRLAFSYFAPREKNNIAQTLVRSTAPGELSIADLLKISLGADVAIDAIAFESRLFALLDRYGIRGGRSMSKNDRHHLRKISD